MAIRFEWDPEKAIANWNKHKVSFEQAREAFKDTLALDEPDEREHYGEERFNRIGLVEGRLLFVTYTERIDRESGDEAFVSSPRGRRSAEKARDIMKRKQQKAPSTRTNRRAATKLPATRHDWRVFDALGDAEILKAARSDPDARPLNEAQLKRMKRPNPKVVRQALGLSQEEFAKRFRIPVGTLRDWEQGRVEPDQAARAYLMVIARNPKAVREALEPAV